mmetsp:Transcript_24231/g.71937  ORF Transcript_24231/g.71937 Transcript_24231/m.71937 type:complete len:200 (-) Transcript_24231:859-1458(-)
MQPTAVHQHAVQLVLVGHVGGSLGSEDVDVLGVEVEQLGELVAVVDLDHCVPLEVVLKSLKVQLQHRRQLLEEYPLSSVLHAVALGVVLLSPLHDLHFAKLGKRLVHVLAALDVQLQVHKGLLARRLVVDIDALDVIIRVALKQFVDDALDLGALHLLLKLFAQYAVELLHVVLHERVVRAPPKALSQVLSRHVRLAVL